MSSGEAVGVYRWRVAMGGIWGRKLALNDMDGFGMWVRRYL